MEIPVVATVRKAVELALTDSGLRPASGRILVALSGGPDSRVLLDALVSLKTALALELHVCAVDHGLRHGSAQEAQGALEVASRLGVRGTAVRVHVPDKSARSARDQRYIALARTAIACGAEAIALGHTASDQAETLIDHLLRGAGSRGLGAMAPRRSLGTLQGAEVDTETLVLIRPLLEVSRLEVEAYVDHEGLAVVRDPSNDDLRFRRSRIRQHVLPRLREERPDLDRALVRLCERLRLDADFIDAEARSARAKITESGAIDLDGLALLHPAIVARILRELCEEAGVPGDRIPLDALLRLCRGRHGTSQIDLPGNLIAERRYARLRIGPPDARRPQPATVEVGRAGVYEVGSVALRVGKALLGDGPLVFRRPQPGDRIRGKKLSDVLVDQKVARPDRARLWALAEPEGHVKWVGLLADVAAGEPTGKIVWQWPSSGTRPQIQARTPKKRVRPRR